MSFASDKLYNGYLRRKMPTIVSKVKVREIIVHLPCLTTHDRENIEAKRETNGNYDGMVLLLECLRRRENWPEQFIEALEACEHTTIAAEIRAEYDALRGVNNSNPSSPSATVIRAHVHPAPSASHLPIPESSAAASSAEAPTPSPPPPPAASASPLPETPVQPEAQRSTVEQASSPEAVPSPEPVPVPPQAAPIEVVPPPSTPPPSPESPHIPASNPQSEVNAHQEPEENSESDIQDISNDECVIPDQLSTREGEVLVDSVVPPVPPCELDIQSQTDPLQTTAATVVASTPPEEVSANQGPEENSESDIQDISVIPEEKSEVIVNSVVTPPLSPCETDTDPDPICTLAASEVSPPQSPSATQANSDISIGSSFSILTPEKHPIQDTTPPEDIIPADGAEPEEKTEPPVTEVVESTPLPETATTSPSPEAQRMDATSIDDSLCLSKPGQLISVQPENGCSPTLPADDVLAEPYSGDSDRLEESDAPPDNFTVSGCSAVTSTTMNTDPGLPCQENGIALNHDDPEENHHESLCQSLEGQEVLVNVVHVSGEPSILNLDGQISALQATLINGEAAREMTFSPPSATTTEENPISDQSHLLPESAEITPELKTLPESAEEPAPRTMPTNRKYILTAAGVGACALLMAWKFKN